MLKIGQSNGPNYALYNTPYTSKATQRQPTVGYIDFKPRTYQ